jgi:hypothetical protein
MITLTKHSELEDLKKREKIQNLFWNEVGVAEHISLPKLKDAVRKEFNYKDERSVQTQIELMQTESKIRIESRVKVWIKQPRNISAIRKR